LRFLAELKLKLTGERLVILGLVGVGSGTLEQSHGLGPLLIGQEGQGDVITSENKCILKKNIRYVDNAHFFVHRFIVKS
jgi:hypothetical protein